MQRLSPGSRPYAMFVKCCRDVSHLPANLLRSATDRPMKKVLKSMAINVTARLTPVNNCAGNIHRPWLMLELAYMDAKYNRRQHLLKIIEKRFGGNSGKCADFLEMKRPQLSRWITSNEGARQGIAEDSARLIEKKLGLASGSMDSDIANGPELQLGPEVIVDFILSLQEDKRDEWLDWLAVHHPAPYRALMNRLVDDMKRNAPPPSPPPESPAITQEHPDRNTVSVSDRRLKQQTVAFADRRKKGGDNA